LTNFPDLCPAQPGAGQEPPCAAAPAPAVARIPVGPREWMLTVPPGPAGSAQDLGPLAGNLAGRLRAGGAPGAGGAVWLPSGAVDERLGAAVVHVRRFRAVTYCSGEYVSPFAVAALSALGGQAGIFTSGRRGGPAPGVTVALYSHETLVQAGFHPAVAFQAAWGGVPQVRLFACAGLLTAAAADTLGRLWTEQAGHRYPAELPPAAGGEPAAAPPGRARRRPGGRRRVMR
jgi:hypothetical protein